MVGNGNSLASGGGADGLKRKIKVGNYYHARARPPMKPQRAGGLRHCKKYEAFGLLNVNDIVLAILQLLKDHDLVVHVDIDIHLSDDIFYSTDRVFMTVYSYFWRLFMGTGHQDDIGVGIDKYYSLNVPLEDGIDDESYHYNTSISNKILVFPSKVMLNVFDTRSFNAPLPLLDGDEDLNEGNDRWDTDDMDSILSTSKPFPFCQSKPFPSIVKTEPVGPD
ncbi:hypothetical protein CUMW_118670 [Citrus unshiu]|nr:hypothetical protein CUMW_118670 [Citrus unshiu]